MKTEIFVNDAFSHLKGIIQEIPDHFSGLGDEIYIGRNDVHLISTQDEILAVKYFKRLTLANRYIFSTVRKSKARRAYEHSELLLRKGITSPEPVAYINCYKYGMLYRSYYISVYTNYLPLMELLELPISESEQGLKAFARFLFRVHKAGVFHKDLTIRNILFLMVDGQLNFSLIDTNRMRFHPYSFNKGMNNLNRLILPVETIGIIAAEYARQAHVSEMKVLNAIVFARWWARINGSIKKLLKKPLHLFMPRYRNANSIIRKETAMSTRKIFG